MRYSDILLLGFNLILVIRAQDDIPHEDLPQNEESSIEQKDQYTFVALIDIVFTDGCRRSCTGTIIHANVVITAGHCFTMVRNAFLQPELSLSFIVIGTQHMFETGYEQYLPIERVITHPRFRGWTADLALVFTFADMFHDKPGQILPLASEKSTTPVDSNVTVLSWGKCKAEMDNADTQDLEAIHISMGARTKQSANPTSRSHHDATNSQMQLNKKAVYPIDGNRSKNITVPKLHAESGPFQPHPQDEPMKLHPVHESFIWPNNIAGRGTNPKGKTKLQKSKQNVLKKAREGFNRESNLSAELVKMMNAALNTRKKSRGEDSRRQKKDKKLNANVSNHQANQLHVEDGRRLTRQYKNYKHSKNWRRDIGEQRNFLTIGVFGYVNLAACQKIVDRTLPSLYAIKNKNEVLCYSSEEFFITNEDSGAPVVQGDELVAVTVGGVSADGEHVAVGMRVSCFCNWIAQHLPNGAGKDLNCCKNCCKYNENAYFSRKRISSGRKKLPRETKITKSETVHFDQKYINSRRKNINTKRQKVKLQSNEESEEASVKVNEKVSFKASKKATEISSDKVPEEVFKEASEQASEKAPEKASKKASEETFEKASEKVSKEASEKASEKDTEKDSKKAFKEASEEASERASEKYSKGSYEEASEIASALETASEKASKEASEETSEKSSKEASEEAYPL